MPGLILCLLQFILPANVLALVPRVYIHGYPKEHPQLV